MSGGGAGISSTGFGQPSQAQAPGGSVFSGTDLGVDNYTPVQTQSSVPFLERIGSGLGGMNTGVQNTLSGMSNVLRGQPQQAAQPFTPLTPTAAPQVNTGNQIADLYQNLLGRQGDEAGMNFWNQQLQSGTSIDDIRNAFTGTDEYKSRQAQQNLNAQNINNMYRDLLGRSPEQSGYDFWVQKANEGVPLTDIRQAIAGSPEYQAVPNRPMGAPTPVQSAPRYVAPIVSESGGAGSGGAMNYQYRRGGIASLLRK